MGPVSLEKGGAPWCFRGAPLLLAVPWVPVTPSQLPTLRGLGVPCGRPSTRALREGGSRPGGAGSGQLLFCRGSGCGGGSYHPWGARQFPQLWPWPPISACQEGAPAQWLLWGPAHSWSARQCWGGEGGGRGARKTLVAAQATPSVSGPSLKAGPSVEFRRPLVSGADHVPALLGCCSAGGGRAPRPERRESESGRKTLA